MAFLNHGNVSRRSSDTLWRVAQQL